MINLQLELFNDCRLKVILFRESNNILCFNDKHSEIKLHIGDQSFLKVINQSLA